MNRAQLLDKAKETVCGHREHDYGGPEKNFGTIARFWEVYLSQKCVPIGISVDLLPEDVAAMMVLLKLARVASGHGKADNWIDISGYAACGAELETGTEESDHDGACRTRTDTGDGA